MPRRNRNVGKGRQHAKLKLRQGKRPRGWHRSFRSTGMEKASKWLGEAA